MAKFKAGDYVFIPKASLYTFHHDYEMIIKIISVSLSTGLFGQQNVEVYGYEVLECTDNRGVGNIVEYDALFIDSSGACLTLSYKLKKEFQDE